MANIRDVARLAKVSPATVSRILNDNQFYKTTDETRERVLRAVAELGYQPLARKRSMPREADFESRFSIGCLLATTRGKYSDPYYLSILAGIEEELTGLGGNVSLIQTELELENPEILNRVLHAGLSGLIMMRPLSEALFSQLHSLIPHIVGIDTGHMPIDNIEYDHLRVSRMAVEYLYRKGHRQIGYIGGSSGGAPLKKSRRFRSYLETMADLELEVRPEWVLNCEWDDQKCIRQIEETHRTFGLPTAFYAASDLMAIAALRALYQLGILGDRKAHAVAPAFQFASGFLCSLLQLALYKVLIHACGHSQIQLQAHSVLIPAHHAKIAGEPSRIVFKIQSQALAIVIHLEVLNQSFDGPLVLSFQRQCDHAVDQRLQRIAEPCNPTRRVAVLRHCAEIEIVKIQIHRFHLFC